MENLVSIVVPVYNIEQYIERCVESLLNQTYAAIEIILVDDGAKDKSGEICDRYRDIDERVVVIHKMNGGLSSARNAGMQAATGEYLLFVDGDDWLDLDYLEISMRQFEQNDIDVLLTPYIREYGDKSLPNALFDTAPILFSSTEVREKLHRRFFGLYRAELHEASKIDDLSTAWGKIYKMSVCKKVEFVDTSIIGTEDAWYNINVFRYVDSAMYIEDTYYHYNKENQNSLVNAYNTLLFPGWKKLYTYMSDFITDNRLDRSYNEALNNRIVVNLFGLCRNVIRSNLTRLEKRKKLLDILRDDVYREAFSKFNFQYLDAKWSVFYFFCKKRFIWGVCLMVEMAERLKKVLK